MPISTDSMKLKVNSSMKRTITEMKHHLGVYSDLLGCNEYDNLIMMERMEKVEAARNVG